MSAEDYIKILKLIKHPEGGFYREVYRSSKLLDATDQNVGISGKKNYSTSIYFLLKYDEVSTFHRIKSDEIWHHYTGSVVRIIIINLDGSVEEKLVGKNINEGQSFQVVIPAGVWFCAEVIEKNSFALVGCTVSPGFEFKDFELGTREKLTTEYPQHKNLITRFTKS